MRLGKLESQHLDLVGAGLSRRTAICRLFRRNKGQD
jgi:hypothetical protein